jgi:hypothetical protein
MRAVMRAVVRVMMRVMMRVVINARMAVTNGGGELRYPNVHDEEVGVIVEVVIDSKIIRQIRAPCGSAIALARDAPWVGVDAGASLVSRVEHLSADIVLVGKAEADRWYVMSVG